MKRLQAPQREFKQSILHPAHVLCVLHRTLRGKKKIKKIRSKRLLLQGVSSVGGHAPDAPDEAGHSASQSTLPNFLEERNQPLY